MTVTSILPRHTPIPAPPRHPLVDAILALAEEYSTDIDQDRWRRIATGLVGDVHVEQVEHIGGVLAEASRIADGTADYAVYARREMAEAAESDATWKAQLLASTVLTDRRAS